ncbi:hypothetical protein O181_089001 [Austropuccinia psidii MF-1]|uniref:Uncharacterized protein n=1 Tax=Austropuccinia psidii MF-1 TaxID=1389203 RepID=A0A9Q3ISR5_9BASI|nr:hypothetical protein [Austropuccinia psidii MF-1]
MVGSFSNLEESQHSFLPSEAPISMGVHPPILAYFTLRASQDINNAKSALRASSSNYHSRRRGMGSLSNTGLKAQERKLMVYSGMDRFQPRPRDMHLGVSL